jgi:small subunit ribosomal protein S3
VIDRTGEKLVVNIHTARPGILIGKRGAEVENLRKELARFSPKEIFINIKEIRKAELDAQLVEEGRHLHHQIRRPGREDPLRRPPRRRRDGPP